MLDELVYFIEEHSTLLVMLILLSFLVIAGIIISVLNPFNPQTSIEPIEPHIHP